MTTNVRSRRALRPSPTKAGVPVTAPAPAPALVPVPVAAPRPAPTSAALPASAPGGSAASPLDTWTRYLADAWWRAAATADTLRQRAENMRAHEAAGMPPLLHFESEPIADAHAFEPPSNYRLLRVTRCGTDHLEQHVRRGAAPVIVIDPRAGHGPGIGGFKRDSEVGMALLEGHPVYFVVFDPAPVEGQTLGAVIWSLARFIDTVAERHPGTPPIVYGNCQGGWAATLALAHCEHRAGLAVLNGSPLSYWAGEAGVNPMRLAGGFTGGAWITHWLADLEGGRFDGAWLVQNFESLRPEGVFKKYDALYAHPEAEHDRFLEFERWWNGYYFLGREEILSIVRDLFIGNRLEDGAVVVDDHCRADLTRIRTPLVIFSSYGDNITPPAQALAWLSAVYPTTEALVAAGQRIVYLFNRKVGHLGIFVSADVARHEHRAILHHAPAIEALPPGLHEMLLDEPAAPGEVAPARFVARRLEDLGFDAHPAGFERVRALSERLDALYSAWWSPLVRALATPAGARLIEQAHPMRTSRQMWSPRAMPALAWLPVWRAALDAAHAADPERDANPWYAMERSASEAVARAIESWRVVRDQWAETAFEKLYPV
ncbi:MAG: DUF3141 domain-containing protein [Burkholderiales bacterium]|nr:DUF3141 domain-containing protein [Burkholderiales bacterium]